MLTHLLKLWVYHRPKAVWLLTGSSRIRSVPHKAGIHRTNPNSVNHPPLRLRGKNKDLRSKSLESVDLFLHRKKCKIPRSEITNPPLQKRSSFLRGKNFKGIDPPPPPKKQKNLSENANHLLQKRSRALQGKKHKRIGLILH